MDLFSLFHRFFAEEIFSIRKSTFERAHTLFMYLFAYVYVDVYGGERQRQSI